MIPYFIGEHLSFNYPLLPGEQYENYYIEFEKEESGFFDFTKNVTFIEPGKSDFKTYTIKIEIGK